MNTQGVRRQTNQHKMSARRCTQNIISLTADTNDDSSPKVSKCNREVVLINENLTALQMSQAPNRPPSRKNDHTVTYPGPDNSNLPRAPRIPTVALPVQKEEQDDGSLCVILPELFTLEHVSRRFGVFD